VFYRVLMQKKAEANYHSRYLSKQERERAFDQANARRASRSLGGSESRNFGGVAGAVMGGLGGLATGGTGAAGLGGALIGGGLGYGIGYLGDKARDNRTLEAKRIAEMSPESRARLLDHKRARRLEREDYDRQFEERFDRAYTHEQLRQIRRAQQGGYRA